MKPALPDVAWTRNVSMGTRASHRSNDWKPIESGGTSPPGAQQRYEGLFPPVAWENAATSSRLCSASFSSTLCTWLFTVCTAM